MDWMDAKKGKFSIKSLYNFLRQEISKVFYLECDGVNQSKVFFLHGKPIGESHPCTLC